MTVVAVLADPPREELVLASLPGSTPLSSTEAADLYAAGLRDVVTAVADSGGELLVNYRPDDLLPDRFVDPDRTAETAVRELVADAVDSPEVRFEKQVGSTRDARVGNTVTHLLREEDATSAAVVDPTVPLLGRTHVDEAAMKLRRSPVVVGPGTGAEVYYAGFEAPVDFEGALAPPQLETVVDRARDAGHAVDFLPSLPTTATPEGLLATVTRVAAMDRADRPVPERTAAVVDDLDLAVGERDGELTLVRR